jgi:hypothetical protein
MYACRATNHVRVGDRCVGSGYRAAVQRGETTSDWNETAAWLRREWAIRDAAQLPASGSSGACAVPSWPRGGLSRR